MCLVNILHFCSFGVYRLLAVSGSKKNNIGGDKIINKNIGYEFLTDECSGKRRAVEKATGEVFDVCIKEMPVGTLCFTPEQQREYQKRQERLFKSQLRRNNGEPLGAFFFVLAEEQFTGVSPETVTRLVYLSTFLSYENNSLMLTQRTPIRRKDLPSLLNLSKATVSRFWKEVHPRYITEGEHGVISINPNVFKKGKLRINAEHWWYQKFYADSIRKLYQATIGKNHKQLGYFFKLLPFINIEYNLICTNPFEENIENIELLSVADFCKMIGYDVCHVSKLLDIYKNITFNINGKQEKFCVFTYDGINKVGAKICINPHILYSGSDYERVKVLGAFYK